MLSASILRRRLNARVRRIDEHTKAKRATAEKVRRRVTALLAGAGFARTKTSFWTRPAGPVVEFVHLHLYSFTPEFRVHTGLRVLNDPFEAIALNGPSSHPTDRYDHAFGEALDAIERCAAEIARYCHEVGEAWWASARPVDRLLFVDSVLEKDTQKALAAALAGAAAEERLARSRLLLGVA